MTDLPTMSFAPDRGLRPHVLMLGGAGDARALVEAVARVQLPIRLTLSLAGRTMQPQAQHGGGADVTVRSGGFGGAEGLAGFMRAHAVAALVNATHPFAAQMAWNACEAARATGTPLLRLQRPPWLRQAGDSWIDVADMPGAVAAIGAAPRRVFLAIGRQQLAPFALARQHHYVVRTIDPPDAGLSFRSAEFLAARGPFGLADEIDLLRQRRVEALVAKNSGGPATYAKIEAARMLGLPVIMVARPTIPPVAETTDVRAALAFLGEACGVAMHHDDAWAARGA